MVNQAPILQARGISKEFPGFAPWRTSTLTFIPVKCTR